MHYICIYKAINRCCHVSGIGPLLSNPIDSFYFENIALSFLPLKTTQLEIYYMCTYSILWNKESFNGKLFKPSGYITPTPKVLLYLISAHYKIIVACFRLIHACLTVNLFLPFAYFVFFRFHKIKCLINEYIQNKTNRGITSIIFFIMTLRSRCYLWIKVIWIPGFCSCVSNCYYVSVIFTNIVQTI